MRRIALLALLAGVACTKVVRGPGGSDGGPTGPVRHAQLLWQFNLPRSAVNLAAPYARLHEALTEALADANVLIDESGAAPTYGEAALVWGESADVSPQAPLDAVLRAAADSGRFAAPGGGAAEQKTL